MHHLNMRTTNKHCGEIQNYMQIYIHVNSKSKSRILISRKHRRHDGPTAERDV